jgi:hypothetical protein
MLTKDAIKRSQKELVFQMQFALNLIFSWPPPRTSLGTTASEEQRFVRTPNPKESVIPKAYRNVCERADNLSVSRGHKSVPGHDAIYRGAASYQSGIVPPPRSVCYFF